MLSLNIETKSVNLLNLICYQKNKLVKQCPAELETQVLSYRSIDANK